MTALTYKCTMIYLLLLLRIRKMRKRRVFDSKQPLSASTRPRETISRKVSVGLANGMFGPRNNSILKELRVLILVLLRSRFDAGNRQDACACKPPYEFHINCGVQQKGARELASTYTTQKVFAAELIYSR